MSRCRAVFLALTLAALTGCNRESGSGPPVDAQVLRPSTMMDFNVLYAKNCAGCHGTEGKGGAAIGLADQVYLAIADDATIGRVTSNGIPGTSMPAFAQHSGGMLTGDQIDSIVNGIRTHWAKPDALSDAHPPPYVPLTPGDPKHGAAVYGIYCSSCHGAEGRGSTRASSIVDASYLALVSDQSLRTAVIAGRPEMGAPDWRGNVPGKPMSAEEVSDVVAWLASQRPRSPGYASAAPAQPPAQPTAHKGGIQ